MTKIEVWRKNAFLSRPEMSGIMEIPVRTIENWEGEVTTPPAYVERLVVNELMEIAQKNIEERARKKMDHLKSDEDGNRPEGKWVVITTDGMNEWIYDYKDMFDAINNCDDGTVAYIICNKGTTSWYEDKKGNIFGDYDSIQL